MLGRSIDGWRTLNRQGHLYWPRLLFARLDLTIGIESALKYGGTGGEEECARDNMEY